MATQVNIRLADLPLGLAMELQELRHRHAAVLQQAAAGRYEREAELKALSHQLGKLLAREARKAPEQRGISMREVSLAVARLFPELREWSVQTALQARMARNTARPQLEQAS